MNNENLTLSPYAPAVPRHCYNCGHDWYPRISGRTRKCPNCQSKHWDHPDAKRYHRPHQPRLLPLMYDTSPTPPENNPQVPTPPADDISKEETP